MSCTSTWPPSTVTGCTMSRSCGITPNFSIVSRWPTAAGSNRKPTTFHVAGSLNRSAKVESKAMRMSPGTVLDHRAVDRVEDRLEGGLRQQRVVRGWRPARHQRVHVRLGRWHRPEIRDIGYVEGRGRGHCSNARPEHECRAQDHHRRQSGTHVREPPGARDPRLPESVACLSRERAPVPSRYAHVERPVPNLAVHLGKERSRTIEGPVTSEPLENHVARLPAPGVPDGSGGIRRNGYSLGVTQAHELRRVRGPPSAARYLRARPARRHRRLHERADGGGVGEPAWSRLRRVRARDRVPAARAGPALRARAVSPAEGAARRLRRDRPPEPRGGRHADPVLLRPLRRRARHDAGPVRAACCAAGRCSGAGAAT